MGQAQKLVAEYRAWREFADQRPPEADGSKALAHSRKVFAEFRAIRHKWRHRLSDPHHRALLDEVERDFAVGMEQLLETAFWTGLRSVVTSWAFWFATEAVLKSVRLHDLTLEHMDEPMRSEVAARLPPGTEKDPGPAAVRQAVEN